MFFFFFFFFFFLLLFPFLFLFFFFFLFLLFLFFYNAAELKGGEPIRRAGGGVLIGEGEGERTRGDEDGWRRRWWWWWRRWRGCVGQPGEGTDGADADR